jgi:ATP-binding cassette subfamily C protein CydCD
VLVFGCDLRGFCARWWLGRVAWCPQEAHLFDSTLRGNLLIARDRRDPPAESELREVLAEVGLRAWSFALPHGLDTRVGSQGARLSGGQRQRLAVARALLARADVVLLDEPTAHLDAASARELLRDLRSALRERIVVHVTHYAEERHAGDPWVRLVPVPARGPC